MINNFKTVSSVNNSYIHLNDNGTQSSVKTNKDDILYIVESINTELKFIDYTLNQLEWESALYYKNINAKLETIESLETTINEGIKNNVPVYKRSLSHEHWLLDVSKKELENLYNNRNGLTSLSHKLMDTKFRYHTILRECKAVLK